MELKKKWMWLLGLHHRTQSACNVGIVHSGNGPLLFGYQRPLPMHAKIEGNLCDPFYGRNVMNGYKTYVGIVGIALVFIVSVALPAIITHQMFAVSIAFFGGLFAVGIVHKTVKLFCAAKEEVERFIDAIQAALGKTSQTEKDKVISE